VKGAMVQSLAHNIPSNLYLRTITALIGIPIVILTIWLGKPYFDAFAIIVLFCLLREWSRMSQNNAFAPLPYILAGLVLYSLYGGFSLRKLVKYSILVTGLGAGITLLLRQSLPRYLLHVLGAIYIISAVFLLIYLVHEGLESFFLWLLIIVWSADTGAYFVGRKVGGPKLAPKISPNKTWSGFIGGIILATCMGVLTGPYLQDFYTSLFSMALVCFVLAHISHMGDLLESLLKRYFDVKDSGTMIPGHGGLLDRLDSILLVSLAAGLMLILGF
jgi:phosphatidate cytidylyltransferase